MNTSLSRPATTADIVRLGVCFGLLAGLVEGVELFVLQQRGLLGWGLFLKHVTPEIVWISMVTDAVVFAVMAVIAARLGRIFREDRGLSVALIALIFVTVLDWLAVIASGRLKQYAILILAAGVTVTAARWITADSDRVVHWCRRHLALALVLTLVIALGIRGVLSAQESARDRMTGRPPEGAPNVILIVVDTLRADHTSAYGYTRPTSPYLETFAREGVLFDRAISTASWTLPSHVSMLTGLEPEEHHAEETQLQNPNLTNLAEALHDRGYRTGAFSANGFYFSRTERFGRGFGRFEDCFYSVRDMISRTMVGREIDDALLWPLRLPTLERPQTADQVNEAVLSWADQDRSRPVFAMLNYIDVHGPFLPPEPYRHQFSTPKPRSQRIGMLRGSLRRPTGAAELQDRMDVYDGSIRYVDRKLKELFESLNERGRGNSLVIITADHGEMLMEHGFADHKIALWREELHVPLLVKWPGHIPAGRRVSVPVSIASIPATVMQLVSGSAAAFHGPVLTDLWQSTRAADAWPPPRARMLRSTSATGPSPGRASSLVTSRWHYVEYEKHPPDLFDWESDPREQRNQAETTEGRMIVRALHACLQQPAWMPCPVEAISAVASAEQ